VAEFQITAFEGLARVLEKPAVAIDIGRIMLADLFGEFIGVLRATPAGAAKLLAAFDEARASHADDDPFREGRTFGKAYLIDLLQRMDDYEVADHSCDPRGWKVCDGEDRCLGEVDHLVGDTETMKVSHLVVDIDDDLLNEDRLVLIPVGYAELEEEEKNVRLRGIPSATLLDLPAYEEKKLSSEVLEKTRTTLRAGRTGDNRHETPRFRDDALRADERSLRAQRAEEKIFSDRKPVVKKAIVVRGRSPRRRTEETREKRRSNGSSEQRSYA